MIWCRGNNSENVIDNKNFYIFDIYMYFNFVLYKDTGMTIKTEKKIFYLCAYCVYCKFVKF